MLLHSIPLGHRHSPIRSAVKIAQSSLYRKEISSSLQRDPVGSSNLEVSKWKQPMLTPVSGQDLKNGSACATRN